jgi:hypothetical protein
VPAAKHAGLTDTLTVPGVLPLAGVADSHVAEVVVDTVQLSAVLVEEATENVLAAGAVGAIGPG